MDKRTGAAMVFVVVKPSHPEAYWLKLVWHIAISPTKCGVREIVQLRAAFRLLPLCFVTSPAYRSPWSAIQLSPATSDLCQALAAVRAKVTSAGHQMDGSRSLSCTTCTHLIPRPCWLKGGRWVESCTLVFLSYLTFPIAFFWKQTLYIFEEINKKKWLV